ncbi:hypothetical protein OTU49_009034, partial [Cherax quadricarinatus]
MMTKYILWLVVVLALSTQALSKDSSPHDRQARQLHRILDPFGLLGKAGEAVHGAVQGLGKTMDQGAQHVSRVLEHGAKSLDSVFKNHMGQVQAGLEEAGKVASIVSEDLADSVSTLVSNHLQGPSEEQAMQREGIVDGFLRMVGIEPSQLGLMALNVLIFLAELITSSFIGNKKNDLASTRSGDDSV